MINPTYFLLVISLSFAVFFVSNAVLSLFSFAFLRLVLVFAENMQPKRRAEIIFSSRLFPPVASVILVLFVLLPAYFLHEPYSTKEPIGLTLAALALISIGSLSFAFYRALRSWMATRKLQANWLSQAEKVEIKTTGVTVFRIQNKFPILAVVGTFKPRIFIAEQVFETLSEAEIEAAIAHEKGHLAAQDNLKRALLRFCSNLLFVPYNRKIDQIWAETAEIVADEYAAETVGKIGAVDLASTIIKVSRLITPGAKPGLPAGIFLVEKNCGNISSRVRRLIQPERRHKDSFLSKFDLNFSFILAFISILLGVWVFEFELYRNVHIVLEIFVRTLR
jgi:beta-lactamase regulating signal transducer with metallopeptidase domain